MLGAVVRTCAEEFGDDLAFVDASGNTLSYSELQTSSDVLAAQLASDAGIAEGSVVALTLPSSFNYVIAYIAIAKLGAITAGINPTLADSEQQDIIERLGPDLVLDTNRLEELRSAAPKTSHPTELPPRGDRDVAIVFTSGTTGPPKGAVFTERHLRAIAEIDLGPDGSATFGGGSPMIASTQFAHVGFMTKLPWYLQTGSRIHILDRWRADDFLELVAAERIETIGAVAPQLALMLRSDRMDQLDVSCVQRIIAGGAASPPALVSETMHRFGADYSIRYSSTESGGVGIGTSFGAPESEAMYTIGRPRPGVEFKLVDDDGASVDPGDVGELCLRSPAVFDRYWNDPEATAKTLIDGWLHSGDLARIDDQGCVVLCGRKSELYIRGGYNVHPAEVEAILSEHPGISAIAIAPRPDDVMGEIGVAVVVPADPSAPVELGDIREFGASRLARWKLPEALIAVSDIPLTNMDKYDRPKLTQLAKVGWQEGTSDER